MVDLQALLTYTPSADMLGGILGISTAVLLLIVIGITVLTGLALFKAAKLNDKLWFWIMLIVGTAGILPAIYLYMRRKK